MGEISRQHDRVTPPSINLSFTPRPRLIPQQSNELRASVWNRALPLSSCKKHPDISRISEIVVVIRFLASNVAPAIIVLFEYEAKMKRSVMHISGEGLMVMSARFLAGRRALVIFDQPVSSYPETKHRDVPGFSLPRRIDCSLCY